MRLPALSAEEKAFLSSAGDGISILNCLAERVGCSLTACLGVPVQVANARVMQGPDAEMPRVPRVVPSREMVNAWVNVRFGGHPETGSRQVTDSLAESLVLILKRALAESVINLGNELVWPAAIGLELNIQNVRCDVECFTDPENLMNWAKAELEGAR